MKVEVVLLALVAGSSRHAARAVDDERQRGLRGQSRRFNGRGFRKLSGRPKKPQGGGGGGGFQIGRRPGGRPKPKRPKNFGGGKWKDWWDGRDDGDGGFELTGRVTVRLKTEKELGKTKPGTSNAWKAGQRNEMRNWMKRRNKMVFESKGEGGFEVFEVGAGKEKEFIADLLANDKEGIVAYAEPDALVYPVIAPNEGSAYNNQYHHATMQNELAWDVTQGLSNVTVAICDTGLEPGHPDLEANRLEGYHAISQTWESEGGDVTNVHPHGTQCAGCAAAIGNNGVGLSGVGWNFKHRPGRVSDSPDGGASMSVLADCAR